VSTTTDIEESVTKGLRKNRVLSFLEAGPQTFKQLEKAYGKGPSSLNRILIELDDDKKISLTIHNKKKAYEITKKGRDSLLSFGIIGMLINQILVKGGLYHEDYDNLCGSMFYCDLPWGIQDDLVYDKKLHKYNPITKETASNIHKSLYNNILQDAKNKKIILDESKTGQVILGFLIDYHDLIKSIKERSLDYIDEMSEKEKDLLAKYEDGTVTSQDIDEQKRLRTITKAKMRKRK